jgi:hypothetical protein
VRRDAEYIRLKSGESGCMVLLLVKYQQVNANRTTVIASERQTAGGKLQGEAIRKREYLV